MVCKHDNHFYIQIQELRKKLSPRKTFTNQELMLEHVQNLRKLQ
jgi:hypothetical protein